MDGCHYCVGKMERKGAMLFKLSHKGHTLELSGLSGYECDKCGEKYFDEDSVEAIERAVNKGLNT